LLWMLNSMGYQDRKRVVFVSTIHHFSASSPTTTARWSNHLM
jgi:hypothetical protein